jgi:hypothetical protein
MHIATLLDLKAMILDIDRLTLESTLKLKAIGAYPYNVEPAISTDEEYWALWFGERTIKV